MCLIDLRVKGNAFHGNKNLGLWVIFELHENGKKANQVVPWKLTLWRVMSKATKSRKREILSILHGEEPDSMHPKSI